MKKIALILAAAVGISMAGPALNSWIPSGTSTPVWLITAAGTYAPNTTAQSLGLTSTYSQTATAAITYTIQAAAVAAGGKWCIHSQNVATTITTSLGTAIVYHGAAGATSVTIPATQSLINVECDGSKCYIN